MLIVRYGEIWPMVATGRTPTSQNYSLPLRSTPQPSLENDKSAFRALVGEMVDYSRIGPNSTGTQA